MKVEFKKSRGRKYLEGIKSILIWSIKNAWIGGNASAVIWIGYRTLAITLVDRGTAIQTSYLFAKMVLLFIAAGVCAMNVRRGMSWSSER